MKDKSTVTIEKTLTDERKLHMLIKTSNEKEKALEKNFIFQGVLILVSILYAVTRGDESSKSIESIPELLRPLFVNSILLIVVMPV